MHFSRALHRLGRLSIWISTKFIKTGRMSAIHGCRLRKKFPKAWESMSLLNSSRSYRWEISASL